MIIRLSGPLKECYAKDHGLDFEKMLSASDYKEKYDIMDSQAVVIKMCRPSQVQTGYDQLVHQDQRAGLHLLL